jgi:hypothetical protein
MFSRSEEWPMATDTRQLKPRLTLADLCEAIIDEKVAPKRVGDEYFLTGLDLRRMERSDEIGTTLDVPTELLGELGDATRGDASLH